MVERTLISLPSQLQLIDRLQHLVYLSSSLIFVSGEAGSGKSTITENLSNTLPTELQQVYVTLTNQPSAGNLRQQIVSNIFDKALFDADDNLLTTILRLQEEQNDARNRLIIIDNAKNLPPDFLIELCELFSAKELAVDNTLNILLLADQATTQANLDYLDSHLVSRLQESLNPLELTLPGLSKKEANALLLHNFQQVGYQAQLQHQDALNQQLQRCNGNPKKIIKLAEDLSQGIIEPIKNSWVKTWLPAILLMLGSVAIVSGLAMYLYPKLMPSEEGKTVTPTIKHSAGNESEIIINEEPRAGAWANFEEEITDNESKVGLSGETEKRVVISDNQLIELSVLIDSPDNNIDTQAQGVNTTGYVFAPATDELSDNVNEAPLKEDNSALSYQDKVNNSETLEIKQQSGITDEELSGTEKSKDIKQSEDKLIDDEASYSSTQDINKQAVSSTQDKLFTPSEILLSKNPKYYTIQISGMASRDFLAAFQQRYGQNRENVYSYQTTRQSKPWFVVVYGEYESPGAANEAIKNLPSVFNGMPTWVKRWQSVHNDLRLNNG